MTGLPYWDDATTQSSKLWDKKSYVTTKDKSEKYLEKIKFNNGTLIIIKTNRTRWIVTAGANRQQPHYTRVAILRPIPEFQQTGHWVLSSLLQTIDKYNCNLFI